MNTLHIYYNARFIPTLDFYIFGALDDIEYNMDCTRDLEYRNIYLYFESIEDLHYAENLLRKNALKQLDNTDEEIRLIDLINIETVKENLIENSSKIEQKIKIRNRIKEIYKRNKRNV